MDLHIDIELHGELLLVTASGGLKFDAASRLLMRICNTAAESRVNKILVNCLAVDGELAAFERYDLGVEIAAYLSEHEMNLKLAFVGTLPTMNGFGVRVARNRGIITNLFPSQQEAVRWLDE
jgi:hypothetical protein